VVVARLAPEPGRAALPATPQQLREPAAQKIPSPAQERRLR